MEIIHCEDGYWPLHIVDSKYIKGKTSQFPLAFYTTLFILARHMKIQAQIKKQKTNDTKFIKCS
jgi:hypothetical protein